MCGIAGLWCADSVEATRVRSWVDDMTAKLVHRGPDASGFVFVPDSGVALGHRRLSILDLSERGAQPMWSHSKRLCISYNGEVYNAPEIRAELDALGRSSPWQGHSDTEVVLEAIEAWGLAGALERFIGMFAFALWDQRSGRLSLVRDRLGIKPLFYSQGPHGVAFASELRALLALPTLRARLNRSVVASFLRFGVVPDAECIVEPVQKVQPGTVVELDGPTSLGATRTYWDAEAVARSGLHSPFAGSDEEAIDTLEALCEDAVSLRMRADVPFGAFLSGGIDSSTVAAFMHKVSTRPVRTFSIGNTEAGYDESSYARAVANHLGCQHHDLVVEPAEALSLVPEIALFWDEPFADSSQLPTYLVSRLTKQHVTVALSGDGGDELFAGYNRHAWAPRLWSVAGRMPGPARRAFRALRRVSVEDWDRAFRALGLSRLVRLPGDKLHKLATLGDVDSARAWYDQLRSHWVDPGEILGGRFDAETSEDPLSAGFVEQMLLHDLTHYLPEDILTKVDRASMAVSLEARVPLLDHRIVELSWRFPRDWKIKGSTQKWILREVLARHVPRSLFERPKMGFGVPVGRWLRGPLRGWGEDLLAPDSLMRDGIFDPTVVAQTWETHQAGLGNEEHRLWAILMFQSWWQAHRTRIES